MGQEKHRDIRKVVIFRYKYIFKFPKFISTSLVNGFGLHSLKQSRTSPITLSFILQVDAVGTVVLKVFLSARM